MYMRILSFLPILLMAFTSVSACASSTSDSIRVEQLFRQAETLPVNSNRVLFFAQHFLGTPYVANTLDEAEEEALVVHFDKLDCTTFVETVLALVLTDKGEERTFDAYKRALQFIRYRDGKIDGYASRLHYFSDWIRNNGQKEVVYECTSRLPFAASYVMTLDFMSTHSDSYPMMKGKLDLIRRMEEVEKDWKEVTVAYLPKEKLNAIPEESGIYNGDILAITTNIKGLDVVHVGFAVWVGEKLHLLHASSAKKEVILDPQSLYEYSKNKKVHTGVRVIRIL